jgi:osmotically-inducible protein OsmY
VLTSRTLSCDSDGGITVEVEPAFRPATVIADDDAIAEALRTFVCALGPGAVDVRVEYCAGVVTVAGQVASATQRQAIKDLLLAHDGVESVVSELSVVAPGVVASGL